MSPQESYSSDEVNKLPAVPRVRRSSGAKPPVPRPSRSASKSSKGHAKVAEKRPVRQSTRRRVAKRSFREDSANSEDDGNESYIEVRRTSRRSQKTRKVIDDDDDDEEDEDEDEAILGNENKDELYEKDDNEMSAGMMDDDDDDHDHNDDDDDDDDIDMEDDDDVSKSASVLVSRSKKRRKTIRESSSDSRDVDREDENGNADGNEDSNDFTNDSVDGEGNELIKRQKDILAQLEAEVGKDDSEDFKSESSDEPKPKRSRRLTSRQRALQGENVKLEYSKLDSPKAKKKDVQEDWDHDEEMEMKRQQKARLRQMVSEKRNKEKRAAMVDKVLRGVTSKRKKFTLATEARAAQIEDRLTQNEMRDGCMRYVSNREGCTLSIPKDAVVPPYLKKSLKAVYPPLCKRDPKTGKREFSNVSTSASAM
ncbi:unnamed protein product [Agarophyton chilense]